MAYLRALRLFRKNSWPDFLILGAQKAGTSALHELLSQHPLVVNRTGEVHFFDLHYHLGTDWYQAQFPKKKNAKMVTGDKSPYYLYHPLVPQRAYSLLPKVKLVVLLRNPIDRAYSQYWMNRRRNREPLSFLDAVRVENERLAGAEERILSTGVTEPFSSHRLHSYLARGRYLEQLKRWLVYYPREQMKILFYEDFRKNPKSVIDETVAFLGLPYYDRFRFKVGEVSPYPPLNPSERRELEEFFVLQNKQLEAFLGRELPP